LTETDQNFRVGGYFEAMSHACGYSRTPEIDGTNCKAAAIIHLWFGTFDDPDASCGMSCAEHASYSKAHAYDWHPLVAVCGVPDTTWRNTEGIAGTGTCMWPAAESIVAEIAREAVNQ
jgi:hypothetical protein